MIRIFSVRGTCQPGGGKGNQHAAAAAASWREWCQLVWGFGAGAVQLFL